MGKKEDKIMSNYVITIARGFGSGGKSIGEELAKQLGISCYEDEIKRMAVVESGLNEELFEETSERLAGTNIQQKIQSFIHRYTPRPEQTAFASQDYLYKIQSEIIKSLAEKESCIIIGKCADFVLKDKKNVLSVYVDAPRAACVKSIAKRMGVDEKEANRLIETTDKYRADYYKYYTGGVEWTNPTNYDLFVNSDRLGRNACVEVIKETLKIKNLI